MALWSVAAMGIYSFFAPFFSIPSRFLSGQSAASRIALINSIGNLGAMVNASGGVPEQVKPDDPFDQGSRPGPLMEAPWYLVS